MGSLTRLLPRFNTRYVSQSRIVLAVGLDGFVDEGTEHGLFVHETRLLSRYRWLIDGQRPRPVVLSNVEQHTTGSRSRSDAATPSIRRRVFNPTRRPRE